MDLHVAPLQSLVEELQAQDYQSDPSLTSAVATLARRYTRSIECRSADSIVTALDWCMKINRPDLCQDVVQTFSHPDTITKDYVQEVLVPLLPKLRTWGLDHGQLSSLAPAFQNIMLLWIDNVLGPFPRPENPVIIAVKGLVNWKCSCRPCRTLRVFLTTSASKVTVLERLSAPKLKHVEEQLATHVSDIVTHQMVASTPPGLMAGRSVVYARFPC